MMTRCRISSFLPVVAGLLCILMPGPGMGGYILDPNFGDEGVRVTDIGTLDDQANAAFLQEDGKIVVAGTSVSDPTDEVAVLRYDGNGNLDVSFNNDGKATFSLGSGDDGANDVVVGEDGSIVVAGYLREDVDGERRFALLRVTPAGILDLPFGGAASGIATLPDGGDAGEATGIVIDGEGRYLVSGYLQSATRTSAVAARFLPDGTLDTTFGEGGSGFRRIAIDDSDTRADFIALQSDGKIVLGGMKERSALTTASLFRLNADGGIDTGYGEDGEAVIGNFAGNSDFLSGVMLGDNSLVAAGFTTADSRRSITTAKFSTAGRLVQTYGANGIARNDLGNDSLASSIAAVGGGFLVGGTAVRAGNNDIVLINLDAGGQLQKTTVLKAAQAEEGTAAAITISPLEISEQGGLEEYGLVAAAAEGEPVFTDIDGGDDSGNDILVTPNGRVLVIGSTTNDAGDDIALVAYTSDTSSNGDDGGGDGGGIQDGVHNAYFIGTIPPSNVTRNGAMSGGVITANAQFQCDEEEDPTFDDQSCPPTVTARGVAFGVAPHPSYIAGDGDGTTTTNGTTTTTNDNGTANSVSAFPDWVANSAHNSTTVRRGQTEDGSGSGTFGSDIRQVTPDVVYYVRAYAVLSDETVIYGNQHTFRTEDACFIATAAYGSPLAAHVEILGHFRDQYLAPYPAGRHFVQLYYGLSPQLADFISQSAVLKLAVRMVMLPLVAFSYFMVYFSLQAKAIFLLLLVGSFFSTQFFLARR